MVSTTQLLERYFPPGSFMRNVAIMLSGTASGPVISVLIMPVLTRLYTPEDFGVLTLFTSFLTVLVAMPTLRYEAAIPLPDNEEDAANLLVPRRCRRSWCMPRTCLLRSPSSRPV